ncbi:MAG: hypothetical protein LBT26_04385 [Clostridiales Family XIII bacterium]|jgi:hypothetical protein|nr:hypothetical protein [Clostridiales Family XIII bacterium]
MARSLTFSINQTEYAGAPVKLDRKKLYGWRETIACDDNGRECRLVSMDETGTLIIPKGGVGLGILSPDQKWVDRNQLKAVAPDGQAVEPAPSSYDAPVTLDRIATAEELLNHSITGIYQIPEADPALLEAIGEQIYTFTYHYQSGYAGSQAFLLCSEGNLFMLLGYGSEFEMLSLDAGGDIEEDLEEEENENDEIDFSMM